MAAQRCDHLFVIIGTRTNDPRQDYEVWYLEFSGHVGPAPWTQMHAPAHKITWFVTCLCSNVILILSDWLGQTQAAGPERGPGGL